MTSTQINQGNYTAYQPYMLLNFDYSFQNDVLDDDLSVTILEVLGRINLNKFIDFHNLDSRSYDPVMMLTIILMAFAEDGYASLRKLEKLCRYDIRYRSITNGCVPSYKRKNPFKRLRKKSICMYKMKKHWKNRFFILMVQNLRQMPIR